MKRWERTLLWVVLLVSFAVVWLLTAAKAALIGVLFLVLLLPESILWNLLARRTVRCAVTLSDSAEKQTAVQGTVTLRFGFWRPVGETAVLLTVENRLTGEVHALRVPLQARPDGFTGEFELHAAHCGSMHAHVRQIRLYDWAGLFYLKHRDDTAAYCTVLPQIYPLHLPPLRQASRALETDEPRENVRGTDRTQTVWLREYTPGDAVSGIHWKLSSKLDKLIYREPGALEDRSLLVFWDRREGTADVLDALAGAVFSFCEALVDTGCPFTLGFVQDGLVALQRIADADTLYGALPLLLRRDRESSEMLPDCTQFGQTIWFTSSDDVLPQETVRVIRCVEKAEDTHDLTPQTLRQYLQEMD
ncbi:MAG: DUF58 domain-containing protein [Clostridia bacterium]|nr:DUF58 domain-containing protein [Clostridia bacterium]